MQNPKNPPRDTPTTNKMSVDGAGVVVGTTAVVVVVVGRLVVWHSATTARNTRSSQGCMRGCPIGVNFLPSWAHVEILVPTTLAYAYTCAVQRHISSLLLLPPLSETSPRSISTNRKPCLHLQAQPTLGSPSMPPSGFSTIVSPSLENLVHTHSLASPSAGLPYASASQGVLQEASWFRAVEHGDSTNPGGQFWAGGGATSLVGAFNCIVICDNRTDLSSDLGATSLVTAFNRIVIFDQITNLGRELGATSLVTAFNRIVIFDQITNLGRELGARKALQRSRGRNKTRQAPPSARQETLQPYELGIHIHAVVWLVGAPAPKSIRPGVFLHAQVCGTHLAQGLPASISPGHPVPTSTYSPSDGLHEL